MTITGYKTRAAALKASAQANQNPRAVRLTDGTWAGVGETYADAERTIPLLLPRGKRSTWAEAKDCGALGHWQ